MCRILLLCLGFCTFAAGTAFAQSFTSDQKLFENLVHQQPSTRWGWRLSQKCEVVFWTTDWHDALTLYEHIDLSSKSTKLGSRSGSRAVSIRFEPQDHFVKMKYRLDGDDFLPSLGMHLDDVIRIGAFDEFGFSCNKKEGNCTMSLTGEERLKIFGKLGSNEDRQGEGFSKFSGENLWVFVPSHGEPDDSKARAHNAFAALHGRQSVCQRS